MAGCVKTKMEEQAKRLESSWENRTKQAKEKALKAIDELKREKEPINFNSVHQRSGVSKNYLYTNDELKAVITQNRAEEQATAQAWHSKYDRTSKTKDVIIETKDKYIAKLETENQQLRKELNQLRTMIYEKK